jgi:hypothetical protein
MMVITDWLDEALVRYDDGPWLTANDRSLIVAIYEALKKGGDHDAGIHALLYLFPHFIHRKSVKRWHKLNRKALKVSRSRKHRESPTDAVRQMYVLTPQKLESAPPRRKRSERVDPRELFEMYLNVFMEYFYVYPERFTPNLIERLLYLTSQINIPYYYNKIYQILGLIYNYSGEYDKALDRIRLANNFWQNRKDKLELALSAYVTAEAYQGLGHDEQALDWMERANTLFSKIDYPEQRSVVRARLEALES